MRAADVREGARVGGFRIVRRLEGGTLGTVYEATQVSLDRTVALRLIGPEQLSQADLDSSFRDQQRRAAAFHHPNAVPIYEVGAWEGGSFVASRFIGSATLTSVLEERSLSRAELTRVLERVAAALDAAHRAGLVHGAVSADNVLVDEGGNGFLADLGLGRAGSPEEDLARLTALRHEVRDGAARRERRRRLGVVAMIGAVASVIGLAVLAFAGEEAPTEPAASVGCSPRPDPNAPLCTLIQQTISGKSAVATSSGVLGGWTVRGAAGELALQVIGRRRGESFLRSFSQFERAPASGVGEFEANLRVERGDLIGLALSPGATIGLQEGESDSAILRWEGAPPLTPSEVDGRLLDGSMLLSVDIESGERPKVPELTGRLAARAPAGLVLDGTSVETATGETVSIDAIRVGERIHLDLRKGGTRRARVAVPDAEPSGMLIELDPDCGFARGFCFRWTNGDGTTPILHAYRVRADALRPIG